MLEEVQRDEGRPDGVIQPRRVIFSGSREWGEERPEAAAYPRERIDHELDVSTKAVARLIARWVQGKTDNWHTKSKAAQLQEAIGLVIIEGQARGLDTHVGNAVRVFADGLKRLTRDAYNHKPTFEELMTDQLAPGLWLEEYPADWDHLGKAAGGVRNQQMLDSGADHVIAFFAHGRQYGPDERGGTNDMVRRAVAANVPVDIYFANDRRWRKP